MCVSKHREYHTYIGWHNDVQILVGSHGVGAGGASCYFEELIQVGTRSMRFRIHPLALTMVLLLLLLLGVTTLIRAGTAGSFTPKIREVCSFEALLLQAVFTNECTTSCRAE